MPGVTIAGDPDLVRDFPTGIYELLRNRAGCILPHSDAAPTVASHLAAQPTLRQVLIQHTAPLHRQLDAMPSLRALLSPALSLAEYPLILAAYSQAYEPLEEILMHLEKTCVPNSIPPYTPRMPALFLDLHRFNPLAAAEGAAQGQELKSVRDLTEWHYWGMRYVLEGATQGGKIIASQLRKNLPQIVPDAFAFWELQLRLAQEWPAFCDRLNQPVPDAEAEQQLLEGASHAFLTFIDCFNSRKKTHA